MPTFMFGLCTSVLIASQCPKITGLLETLNKADSIEQDGLSQYEAVSYVAFERKTPGAYKVSRVPRLMNSETDHRIQCLQQIHKVIGKANEILAGVSHPSVCSEVLLSKPGTAYILGLSEVYRVSKRLEDGAKAQQLANEMLQHALREVDKAWNNLLSFLVFGHPMFQMLVPTGNSDPVIYKGSYYHASCANFWLNCVDVTLPKEKGPLAACAAESSAEGKQTL